MDHSNLSEPTAALVIGTVVEPIAQTSPSLRSNRHAKRALRNSRVHFDEDGFIPPMEENPVVVRVLEEEQTRSVGVYLGFLQEEHKYEIKFSIPVELCKEYLQPNAAVTVQGINIDVHKEPNVCSVQNVEWVNSKALSENGASSSMGRLQLAIELQIPFHSMPSFEDKFTIRSDAIPDHFVHISISAQIMGKHMGTPSLKDGIKCIGHCPAQVDSDSEAEAETTKGSS